VKFDEWIELVSEDIVGKNGKDLSSIGKSNGGGFFLGDVDLGRVSILDGWDPFNKMSSLL
jgi:hypothetical protein